MGGTVARLVTRLMENGDLENTRCGGAGASAPPRVPESLALFGHFSESCAQHTPIGRRTLELQPSRSGSP